jgi:hypothetical protein
VVFGGTRWVKGVYCARNGSGSAERWTSVSPSAEDAREDAAAATAAEAAAAAAAAAGVYDDDAIAMVGRCRSTLSNPR